MTLEELRSIYRGVLAGYKAHCALTTEIANSTNALPKDFFALCDMQDQLADALDEIIRLGTGLRDMEAKLGQPCTLFIDIQ